MICTQLATPAYAGHFFFLLSVLGYVGHTRGHAQWLYVTLCGLLSKACLSLTQCMSHRLP